MAANYETQQLFLDTEQARISAKFFETGVTMRVISGMATNAAGVELDLSDLNVLDRLYVPSLGSMRDDGIVERELSLAALTPTEAGFNVSAYYRLGTIDRVEILHPYDGVDRDAAEVVYRAALELTQARDEGLLPNIRDNLLDIENIGRMLIYRPPEAQ